MSTLLSLGHGYSARALARRLLLALGAEKFAISGSSVREDPASLADEAGAMALFGMANVPFVYVSVNYWRTLHPKTSVVMTLAPGMRAAFWSGRNRLIEPSLQR